MKDYITFLADNTCVGKQIYDVLRYRYGFSTALLRRTKQNENYLTRNYIPAKLYETLIVGDLISVYIGDEEESKLIPIMGDVNIVYEDEYLAVIDKSAGVVTHPSPGFPTEPSIAGFLTDIWRKRGDNSNFHAVNRLDRGTSGLMISAKTGYCNSILVNDLHTEKFKRTYLAVVSGILPSPFGKIDLPISRSPDSIVKRIISKDGAPSLTCFEKIASYGDYTLVKLKPMTGRTHQLRLHLSSIGCPIVGDDLYGGKNIMKRPALHSARCTFTHPTTGIRHEFISPLPPDIRSFFV